MVQVSAPPTPTHTGTHCSLPKTSALCFSTPLESWRDEPRQSFLIRALAHSCYIGVRSKSSLTSTRGMWNSGISKMLVDLYVAGSSSCSFSCHSSRWTALRAAASCCCLIRRHVCDGRSQSNAKHKNVKALQNKFNSTHHIKNVNYDHKYAISNNI